MPEYTPKPPEPGPETPPSPELPPEPLEPELDEGDDDLIPRHDIDDAATNEI